MHTRTRVGKKKEPQRLHGTAQKGGLLSMVTLNACKGTTKIMTYQIYLQKI